MATSKQVVELLFSADYRGQPEMMRLKKDVSTIADQFDKSVRATAAFTTAMIGLEVAALGASIGLAKAGVEAAGKFGDSFNEISTLISATDEELTGFSRAIQSYASNSTSSIEDINGAVYNAISAGVAWGDSLDFLREAEKLSVAGKADLNSVVQTLTGSLNAYGVSTEDAGKFSDVLFATVRNGVTTIPELSASLGQVTGIAASLNVPFEDLNAVIATLTANGVGTSQAITAIKAALSNIIKPTADAAKAAEELGIGFDYSALQSKGFVGLMQEIAEKSGGNEQAVTRLFGSVEGLNAALSLTSESGAQTFIDKLSEIQNASGATDKAFEKMADNAALIKQTLQNNLELTLIAIGEPLLDEFKDIDKAITDIFRGLRSSIEDKNGLGQVVSAVERVANTISQIISNMARNTESAFSSADLSGFVGAFDTIDKSLAGLDLTTPEGLAKTIGAIGKAFEGLTQFSVSAASVLKDLMSLFGELVNLLNGVDTDTIKVIGTIGGLAIAITAVSAVLTPFIAVLKGLKAIGGVSGAIGTATTLAATGTALGGVVAALGKLGVAGAALGGGYLAGGFLAETTDKLFGWSDAFVKASEGGEELTAMLERFRVETGNTNATMEDYAKHLKAKREADESARFAVEDLTEAQEDFRGSISDAVSAEDLEKLSRYADVVLDAEGNLVSFSAGAKDAGNALDQTSQSTTKAGKEFNQMSQAAKDAESVFKTLDAFKPVFDFQIARVQADAKKVESIMESLGQTVKTAGDGLVAALGVFSSGEYQDLDVFAQNSVLKSIDKQNQILEKSVDAQVKMSDAQADLMRQRARQMAAGGALIQIDGTRLEPQLEAFMMEILKAIQIRMAESEADFLLGINSL